MAHHRALWLLSLCFALSACKKSVGSSCEKGEARCLSDARQLICQDGAFIEAPCRGPEGCTQEGYSVRCDISGNRAQDPCSTDEQGAATCKGAQTLLSCRGGKYVESVCRGPNGCERQGDRSVCDRSIAAPDDDCDVEGSKACSPDNRQVLACRDGKMARLLECRGPRGCASVAGKLECDLSIAAEQDPCESKLEGHVACTPDGDGMVRCHHGRFVIEEQCGPKKRCVTRAASTQCIKE